MPPDSRPILARNLPRRRGWLFTDVTAEIGSEAFGRSAAAAYGDYDHDGPVTVFKATARRVRV